MFFWVTLFPGLGFVINFKGFSSDPKSIFSDPVLSIHVDKLPSGSIDTVSSGLFSRSAFQEKTSRDL